MKCPSWHLICKWEIQRMALTFFCMRFLVPWFTSCQPNCRMSSNCNEKTKLWIACMYLCLYTVQLAILHLFTAMTERIHSIIKGSVSKDSLNISLLMIISNWSITKFWNFRRMFEQSNAEKYARNSNFVDPLNWQTHLWT